MTKLQRLPIIKQRGKYYRIRRFLKECGLSIRQIKQFSDIAIQEVSDLIHTGALGKVVV